MRPYQTSEWEVNWSDNWAFINWCCGNSARIGPPATGLNVNLPLSCPENPYLLATSINFSGYGTIAGISSTNGYNPVVASQYKYSRVVIQFEAPNYGVDDPTATSDSLDGSMQLVTVPGSVYKFSDGTPTEQDVVIPIFTIDITRTRTNLAAIDYPSIKSCLGKINLSQYGDFEAKKLLFQRVVSRTERTGLGSPRYTLDLVFSYQSIEYGKKLHPDGTTGWAYVTDGSGNEPFDTADFSVLTPSLGG